MLRRLGLLFTVTVLGLGLLAVSGCGGDDKKGEKPASTSAPSDDGNHIGTPAEEQVKAAVGACKQSIKSQPQLKGKLRTDLEDICDKAASGDVSEARKASQEVCTKIIEDLVPAGSARDQALTACKQSTQAP